MCKGSNIPCTEAEDHIIITYDCLKRGEQISVIIKRCYALVAVGGDVLRKAFMIAALYQCFTSRIHRQDDHMIGMVKAGAKISIQILQPTIAMRLHHGDDPALAIRFSGGARGFQHRFNLDRMVRVIIDNACAVL